MGLFGRRSAHKGDEPDAPATPQEAESADEQGTPETDRPRGPWDVTEVAGRGKRLDLGAVWLPGVDGMQVRMEIDKKTEQVTGVSVMIAGSALQVQAFAAPRTEGIWDEIREEIAASLTKQGAKVDDIPGVFGRELLAQITAKDAAGKSAVRAVRFIGFDGPRWFLRGVLTGKAAADSAAAEQFEALFADVVVVRDQVPRAPRDLLALKLPDVAQRKAPEQPGAPKAADFNPLKRGPEITETR